MNRVRGALHKITVEMHEMLNFPRTSFLKFRVELSRILLATYLLFHTHSVTCTKSYSILFLSSTVPLSSICSESRSSQLNRTVSDTMDGQR